MKKLWFLILSIFWIWLWFNQCFWYDVIIYGPNNEFLYMYPVEEWTVEITLDWNWSKNWNDFTFLDWFNWTTVSYVDWYWKNQSVNVKSDLYINWDYSILYTWQQDLLLTNNTCGVYEWYTPIFDVTWEIQDVSTSWNVFNNFAENSLKVLLSNVPSYIQYVIIILIFMLIRFFSLFVRILALLVGIF